MIRVEEIKSYCISWLNPSTTTYDNLIQETIRDVVAYIDNYISYNFVYTEYEFREIAKIESGVIYTKKFPINKDVVVEDEDGNALEVEAVGRYKGKISVCRSLCDGSDVEVLYKCGGVVDEYPTAVKGVAIELILSKFNHYINNANGFNNTAVGEINMSYNFNLTETQKHILDGFV